MLQIRNHTDLEVGIAPDLDAQGRTSIATVIKGTFDGGGVLLDEQEPIVASDIFHGEPATSSLKYGSDACTHKPGTDVVVLGTARAERAVTQLDVAVQAGPLQKVVRVLGDRKWEYGAMGWSPSDPIPFSAMPLVYERAYGGWDRWHEEGAPHVCDRRNPAGTGFATRDDPRCLAALALPNLEDPNALVERWNDRPAPAGFGFVAPHWTPRRELAGTHDAAWERDQAPLRPTDWSARFNQAASAGLVASPHFTGGEPVTLYNIGAPGRQTLTVPRLHFRVAMRVGLASQHPDVRLDTVIVDADRQRTIVLWRAAVACPVDVSDVRYVDVQQRSASA